jgi:uncharacterized protein HemX
LSQQEQPENPSADSPPEAVSEQPPPPPERTRGRAARFVRHRATQLVAVGLLAAVIGGGAGVLAVHEEGESGHHREHRQGHDQNNEGDHEGDHEGDDGR